MQALKVTPSSAKADLTMSASRMSWKGRTFDSRRDLTFSEIQRRVVWDTVGLLAGTRLGSCNHQFLSQGGRHLSIPSCRADLRKSECHSRLGPAQLLGLPGSIPPLCPVRSPAAHHPAVQTQGCRLHRSLRTVRAPVVDR